MTRSETTASKGEGEITKLCRCTTFATQYLDKVGEWLVVGVGCNGCVVAVDGAGRGVGVGPGPC